MTLNTRTLAKQSIRRLEAAIKSEFGLKLIMGAELEFTLEVDDRYHDNSNILNIPDKDTQTHRANRNGDTPYTPASDISGAHTLAGLFHQSPFEPYIAYMYKEDEAHQYELVFSHLAKNNSSLMLPRVIDTLRDKLTKELPHYSTQDNTIFPIKSVSFDGTDKKSNNNNGMHINISLEDNDGEAYLTSIYRQKLMELIWYAGEVTNESLGLVSVNDESLERIKSYGIESHTSFGRKMIYTQSPYEKPNPHFECTLASADADPYLAVTAGLVGVYHGLTQMRTGAEQATDQPAPQSFDEAIQALQEGTLVRGILNKVSNNERLGDKLIEAVIEQARNPQPKAQIQR